MSQAGFAPVAAGERITTLDVIRGIALFGILLMNVEFWNRPVAELDIGLPPGATGIDHWAGWFVHVFVRSKFWTMFSLLFGMGFAVMLARAQDAGRPFVGAYVRRTLALAAFGFLHAVFLWNGDILFDYAMGAAFLLVVFHARPKVLLWIGVAGLLAAALVGGLHAAGIRQVPWAPFLGIAALVLLLWGVTVAIRKAPVNGLRNVGLALFLLPCLGMLAGGLATPQATQAERDRMALEAAKTPGERAKVEEAQARQAGALREHEAKVATERRIMSTGTYAEAVAFRLGEFPRTAMQHIAFSLFFVLGMFLLGAWFIRSGLMADPGAHLDVYRRLALFGIPVGLGLSIVSAAIATTHVRGVNDALYLFSMGLSMVASLPASLGYVAAIVLLFHSPRFRGWVAPFAPAGRMALTVYLAQSLIGVLVFHGYGLGWWGLGRALQLVYCVVVSGLLLIACHAWLSRFRYGPMEWLWRAVTYLRLPEMRARVALRPA